MASTFSRRAFAAALAGIAVAVTTACGGGDDDNAAPAAAAPAASSAPISRVVVAGDSLADVGTFGFKATVQNAANPAAGYPIYPEIVASGFGASQCHFFSSADRMTFSKNAGCTNFAVAATQIVNPVTRGGSLLPVSLQKQLETAVDANGGTWKAGDLLLVDAGANDAAGLADAYLDARGGGTAAEATYVALLAQQLSGSTITQTLARSDGRTAVAGLYMQQLARTYWATVKANTLDKGAARVALLDVPDITLTPRFRTIVAEMAAAEGTPAATAFQTSLRQWIAGFNTELARLVAGEPRVALVRYSEDFTAQGTNPAAFGLTNATSASCPPVGDFPACTDAALDASPPPGLARGWWKTWAFSDEFHPSPRGHELLSASVNRALSRAGWR